ncbi:MAG TPA: hypothetical protein VL486_01250 [Verrucomicrobiae bacterium]|nr:hypothetical protein [Verrucomicrobiae bacterium]
MIELYKLGVKIFTANPAAVDLRDFIPVFHSWIQQQKIAGHLLIDVHDYSHVYNGPGILLVAHEGNFSVEQTDDHLGLVYYRKQPVANPLQTAFESAQAAVRLLEAEPKLGGIEFRADEFEVFSNDRLLAPNTVEARQQLEPVVKHAFAGATVTLAPQSADPRERLAFVVNRG